MHSFSRFSGLALLLLLTIYTQLFAQKQHLEPEDYGQWQSISTAEVSPDGDWFAYNISLVDGDGWLTVKKVGSDSTGEHKFMHGVRPAFSSDSKWAAFLIGVSEDEQKKLEEQEKPVKYDLGLMNLATAKVDTFTSVQSYTFSDNGRHLVMQKYKPEEVKTEGSDVILRNLQQGTNQLIGNVAEYEFNKSGTHLAIRLDASEKLGNGIHLHNLRNNSITVLDSDTAKYANLTWNEEGTNLAFLKAREDKNFEDPTYLVHAYRNVTNSPQKLIFDQTESSAFPDSFRVVDYRQLTWSENNNTLFFGIKKWEPAEEKQDTTETKAETAETETLDEDLDPTNVEIWHWRDDRIQPRQEVMADQDRRSNHLSAWHLDENRFVQIGTDDFDNVVLTDDHRHAIGYDPSPYKPRFRESWNDVYLIEVQTGDTTKVLQRHEYVQSSPDGNYLLYFKEKNWYTYDIDANEHINLTGDVDKRFENFKNVNGREYRRPFGSGQWVEDDAWVLLYDEYDVYRFIPDGSNYTKLTNGAADEIRYRQTRLDYEEDYLEKDQPVYFSMYGEYTKNRGYARLDANNNLETLVYEPKMINRLAKADSTDNFVYQVQTATDSPDFYHVSDSFEDPVALTNTNPQQDDYYWADDELITFTNERGEKLQGRLLYPANYEEGKQYPMITYIYERRSQTMHSYSMPSRTSPYNFRRFSSEGYFVFQPDITYELRNPGISAVECVVPAVEEVLETGMIDEKKIGLTGHSWGAYQTSFIITQTDIFNSAVAGAPLTNMVSMYNSIYWNTGMTDATIFEISQGRFPEPWWYDWDNFIDNSPIFNMQNAETPLLVEFGTDDGAVDFNQGVELYNTMRRMEKPFVMLVYEGENHGLARKENQIDYATRAFEWHEHFLLGKEPAEWITDGLPYLERPATEKEKD